jgi:uncharacterized protein YyaL (SSP411 family)
MTVEEEAKKVDRPVDQVQAVLAQARAKLLAHREQRVHPATDDKVLAAWNGLAITAMATGYQVLGDPRYLEASQRAASFVLTDMRRDGRLLRTWRGGEGQLMGYLEDYAFVADGLLTLFESDFDPRWLEEARSLLAVMEKHFLDETDGAFFFTADDHEKLVARNKSVTESSVPSGQAVAAMALLRAGLLLGDQRLEGMGTEVLRANHIILERYPIAAPSLLLAVEFSLADPREVVLVGESDDAAVKAFLEAVRGTFPPHHVVTLMTATNRGPLIELAPVYDGKDPVDGKAAAYVCRHGACELPVTDPAALKL